MITTINSLIKNELFIKQESYYIGLIGRGYCFDGAIIISSSLYNNLRTVCNGGCQDHDGYSPETISYNNLIGLLKEETLKLRSSKLKNIE